MTDFEKLDFYLDVLVWKSFGGEVELDSSIAETWESWCKRNEPEEEIKVSNSDSYPDDIPF